MKFEKKRKERQSSANEMYEVKETKYTLRCEHNVQRITSEIYKNIRNLQNKWGKPQKEDEGNLRKKRLAWKPVSDRKKKHESMLCPVPSIIASPLSDVIDLQRLCYVAVDEAGYPPIRIFSKQISNCPAIGCLLFGVYAVLIFGNYFNLSRRTRPCLFPETGHGDGRVTEPKVVL